MLIKLLHVFGQYYRSQLHCKYSKHDCCVLHEAKEKSMIQVPRYLSRALNFPRRPRALPKFALQFFCSQKVVCDNNFMIIVSDRNLWLVDVEKNIRQGIADTDDVMSILMEFCSWPEYILSSPFTYLL